MDKTADFATTRIATGRGRGKLIELEALRGLAALLVLVHHSLLAFFPRFHGLLDPGPHSLFGTPLFAAINGSAAVILFFVLSGFVLTLRSFQHPEEPRILRSALKRWPRLMFPVLIVNLASGILAGWGLYANADAAAAVKSTWLGWFFVNTPEGFPAVEAAAQEGAITTFLFGDSAFNSSLWTMQYEFFGSFLCLATALLMLLSWRLAPIVFLLVAAAASLLLSALYWPFLAGVGLAALHASRRWGTVTSWMSRRGWRFWLLAVAVVVVLAGYHESGAAPANPLGLYAALHPLYERNALATRVVIHSLAAAILIVLTLSTPALARTLRGGWGASLGRLSFPIYLVQVPVICSMACYVYLASRVHGDIAASVLALVTAISGSLVAALPLMKLEEAWLALLGRLFSR